MNAVPAQRVLVVEDEEDIAGVVLDYLRHAGYAAEHVADGRAALARILQAPPDLTLLDVMLPGLDGLEVLRQARRATRSPVILLTARVEEVDRLIGLELGADDYICKPFSPREVVARVRAMLRRPRTLPDGAAAARRFGELTVDPLGREVRVGDRVVELTATEFDVLATLARSPNVAFSRTQLIESIWGPGWVGDERLVDVHVGRVRRKLGDDAGDPRFVRTVRGVGYRMGPG